ncbi:MAG: cold shock domain-containing protein [Gemmatimonadetes bacterium]|nr:cold shock domain-containing protein [Gemmatimonadota bacterium]
MTTLSSGSGAGKSVSVAVRWYDPVKGYGFLVPDDGSSDIYCRESSLTAVGLATLLAGATVGCETVTTARGPEVSRILSIDFSTAALRSIAPAGAAGIGQIADGSDAPALPGRQVRAIVKWFHADKGYGFLELEDGSADVFCHISAVEASGRDVLLQGAAVTCAIVQGDRGPQVSRIFSVEAPVGGPGPADRSRPPDLRYAGRRTDGPRPTGAELPGSVKFFDPERGFGFVVPDEGDREVFVHSSVLFRSGMTDLEPGQRVFVRVESVPRGLQATQIEPL